MVSRNEKPSEPAADNQDAKAAPGRLSSRSFWRRGGHFAGNG
jgi:hypothetical protein